MKIKFDNSETETIKSKFAVARDKDGCTYFHLYENENDFSCSPLWDTVYEDVVIEFNDNGSITLKGNKQQWSFSLHDWYPDDDDLVDPSYIKQTRFFKSKVVRAGWYKEIGTIPSDLVVRNYSIEKGK